MSEDVVSSLSSSPRHSPVQTRVHRLVSHHSKRDVCTCCMEYDHHDLDFYIFSIRPTYSQVNLRKFRIDYSHFSSRNHFRIPRLGIPKTNPRNSAGPRWESLMVIQDGDIPRLKCPQCKKTCCLLCPKPQHFRCCCCSCWWWCWCWRSCWWCWWWYVFFFKVAKRNVVWWTGFLNSWRSWDKTSQPHKKSSFARIPSWDMICQHKNHNKHKQKQGFLLGGGFTPTCGNDPIWL